MQNYILNCLSDETKNWAMDNGKVVTLTSGGIIYRAGAAIDRIYFPMTSVIASFAELEKGRCLCVGLIGNEGMLGASSGLDKSNRCLKFKVIESGAALSINTQLFRNHLATCNELSSLINHFLYATMLQNVRNAACCYLHDAKQRLSRCLLTISQRLHSKELNLTHNDLGDLLGIRRNTVTGFANALQTEGVIRYSRGHIILSSRSALIRTSCECYEDEKSHHEAFFKNHGHWRYGTEER
ncbi:Crp/Fnr family transcriptional regulator [Planctobacterium marinum]|uniref:Crp/Fnr family transcriptional regulator n=1 Tax=Planctobacterium marinum TaxID=1631968 RepID=UPI001E33C04F|nr:Crp/Fnr family transcriptional regulator [Planctobacterium marinum]MCC2604932.1 Crp/Fnr family transcriptional regulator [Planctobacterium marinum]